MHYVGAYELEQNEMTRAVAFLIIGSLCLLPGGYGCYVVYDANLSYLCCSSLNCR